LWKRLKQNFIR